MRKENFSFKKTAIGLSITAGISLVGCAGQNPTLEEINPGMFSKVPQKCVTEGIASFQQPNPTIEICTKDIGKEFTSEKVEEVLIKMGSSNNKFTRQSAKEFKTLIDNNVVFFQSNKSTEEGGSLKNPDFGMSVEFWGGFPELDRSSFRIKINSHYFYERTYGNELSYEGKPQIIIPEDEHLEEAIQFSLLELKAKNYYREIYGNDLRKYEKKALYLAKLWFAKSRFSD